MQSTKTETYLKFCTAALLIFVVGAIYLFNPGFFPALWTITTSGDIEKIAEYLRSFGVWAMLFSFIIDVLINALGFLPSIFISTANGVVFGIGWGVVISWLAETVGVVISFILMRSILRSSAEKLIAKSNYLKKVDEFSGENGFKMMLIARTLPYFPSGIITAVGALSQISLRDYIFANLIGKFPSTALEVIIGHDAVNYEKNIDRLAMIVIVSILVYGGILWYRKQQSNKK